MKRTTAAAPEALARDHPEWKPWLALLVEAQGALKQAPWARVASARSDAAAAASPSSAPLLDGAEVAVEAPQADRFVRHLFKIAAVGSSSLAAAARHGGLDALGLLEAAVCQDFARLDDWARRLDVQPSVVRAIAAVAAMPLLHACQRAGKALPSMLSTGYCPICGAWPALAEARGLERSRQLRCARCGSDWRTDWLRCPFCRNADHTTLGSLVGESTMETFSVETCESCHGYLKTLTTLRPTPPDAVALVDLASVDLDVAALEHGYARPAEPAHAVRARLVPAA